MRVFRSKPCKQCGGNDFVVDKHGTYRCYACRVRYKKAAFKAKPSYDKRARKVITNINKISKVPAWLTALDRVLIRDMYSLAGQMTASTGIQYVVDHVTPLRGELVCGLHVLDNLQVLTHSRNSSKGKKYTIT